MLRGGRTFNIWTRKLKDAECGQLILVSKRHTSDFRNISTEYMGARIKVDDDG